MLLIINLIEPRMGKLILNNLIGNACPEFRNGLLDSYFFELALGSGCLELCFWRVAFKTILNQQHYKNTSRLQTRALAQFVTYVVYGYYTESKRLRFLEFFLFLLDHKPLALLFESPMRKVKQMFCCYMNK